jgi:hypothetical protein
MKKLFGIVVAVVMILGTALPVMAADPSITPSSIDEVILPGGWFVVEKSVQTPVITPKPDILFLADTTGSMGPAIANVAADVSAIMSTVLAAAPDAEFGVANYKDYPYDPYVTLWQLQMTSNTSAVQDAINTWNASGGFDWPEGWFASLDRAVNPAAPGNPGWRSDSTKIIVLFGDAPAHDPVPPNLTGLTENITESSLTADLVAAGVKMVFVSLATSFPEGLNRDPTLDALDYQAVDPGYIPGGTAGQATRIAAATGGVSLDAPTADDVANQILAGLTSLPITVSMTSDATAPLSTTFSPASQNVTSGTVAIFTENITVAANATGGTYTARDWALIDGLPMTDAAGNIIYETKTIRVPEGFLTGGGQIKTGKRPDDGYNISFAGNVGFLVNFSLVGQWQTNFLNVSVDSLDGAMFHSTNITSLQFANDGGAGPNPPPANSNIASFTATGRLNGEDGWTLSVRLADRGEPGKNDSIRLMLTNPAAVVVYDSLTDFPSDATLATTRMLAAGNLQIHSGLK